MCERSWVHFPDDPPFFTAYKLAMITKYDSCLSEVLCLYPRQGPIFHSLWGGHGIGMFLAWCTCPRPGFILQTSPYFSQLKTFPWCRSDVLGSYPNQGSVFDSLWPGHHVEAGLSLYAWEVLGSYPGQVPIFLQFMSCMWCQSLILPWLRFCVHIPG